MGAGLLLPRLALRAFCSGLNYLHTLVCRVMDTEFRFTKTFRRLVANTNINDSSLLATDYLNHFNEIVMILEMVPDMPEMIKEAIEWQPRSYVDHFELSSFTDKKLAIWAYENAPPDFFHAFEDLLEAANVVITTNINKIDSLINTVGEDQLRDEVSIRCKSISLVLEKISAVINGSIVRMDQH